MGKKIAIIGTTASMLDAPYDDKSWEIWGLNGAYTQIPRFDSWFDVHDLKVIKQVHRPEYIDFLTRCGDKLYLNKKYEEFPEAKVFPYQEILAHFNRKYVTNTIAWLTALAIMEEPEEIGVWGVNMATDTEYMHQRPCCEYFFGIAEGRGIKITVPDSSELLKGSHLYGIEARNPILVKLPDKHRELVCHAEDNNREMRMAEDELSKVNGVMLGIRMACDIVRANNNDKQLPNILTEFEVVKSKETQEAARQLNSKLIHLYEKRAFYDGAMGYHNWIKLNFGG